MICVRNICIDRDGIHAVMHEKLYSLFTPCRVYEDSQILSAKVYNVFSRYESDTTAGGWRGAGATT